MEVAKDLNIDNALNFDATAEGVCKMSVRFRKAGRKFATLCEDAAAPMAMYDRLFEEE